MPPAELVSRLVPTLVAAYLCLLGPGQACWRGRGSGYPRLLARIGISALWTTVVGLALAWLGACTLPRIVLINGALTLAGYLLVGRVRDEGAPPPERALALPIILAAGLWAYWPPFETFIGGSDAVTYTTAGVHLARDRSLSKEDDLGPLLSPATRDRLFTSVLDRPRKPPFMRLRGGVVVQTKTSTTTHPNFFPAPIIWSGLCADALGARLAGGYAALFATLAVAATWAFARRLLAPSAALAAGVLVAANAAAYWSARMPLSEPLSWFFLWVGLGALAAWDEDGVPCDARLAGFMLGAAGLVRIEYAVLLVCLLCARYLASAYVAARPLPIGFGTGFVTMLAVTGAQAALLYGAYTAPIVDSLRILRRNAGLVWSAAPAASVLLVVATTAALYFSVRRFGVVRTLAGGFLIAFLIAYTVVLSEPRFGQTFAWLQGYAGWPALAAATCGILLAHRRLVGGRSLLLAAVVLGGLVLYDPHVMPVLPWGARRLVPFVLPAVFILAAMALSGLGARRPVLAGIAWTLVFAFALAPARPLWGRDFYGGGYDRLAELDSLLPPDAIVLVDASVGSHLFGVGLWYAFDRNTLPVDVSSTHGRSLITAVVRQVSDHGDVYLLKRASAPNARIPFVRQRPYAEHVFDLLLPKVTYRRPPSEREVFPTIVAIRELEKVRMLPRKSPP